MSRSPAPPRRRARHLNFRDRFFRLHWNIVVVVELPTGAAADDADEAAAAAAADASSDAASTLGFFRHMSQP